MLAYEEALARILAAIPPPVTERIALADAQDRVLAVSAPSPVNLPPLDNSSMDGYAVRAADVATARAEKPTRLRLIGKAAAGEFFPGTVKTGTAVRLFTGSPLPQGADAVVMQEDTRGIDGDPNQILILEGAKPADNVRARGEDIRQGEVLVEAGQDLNSGRASVLAAAGLAEVTVNRQPVVGLLATGSELRPPGEPLVPGQIYESNRLGLSFLARRAGAVPLVLPIVPDEPAATRRALTEAFRQCDVVVTSGGVSVGEMDFVKSAFADLGGELDFWKVAIKPGRPFVFGKWQKKFLFGLPGNPVSAMVTFVLLVRPALRRWQGAADVSPPCCAGVLAEPLANPGDRRHFLRVQIDTAGMVRSAGGQASHLLGSLAAANGLLDVPPQTTIAAGTAVRVIRWE